jgi:hypothetical protein
VRSIHIAGEPEWVLEARERGQSSRIVRLKKRDMGKRSNGSGAPELDAPIDSIAEILGNVLEAKKVDAGRLFCKLGKGGDDIANIRARSDIGLK